MLETCDIVNLCIITHAHTTFLKKHAFMKLLRFFDLSK